MLQRATGLGTISTSVFGSTRTSAIPALVEAFAKLMDVLGILAIFERSVRNFSELKKFVN